MTLNLQTDVLIVSSVKARFAPIHLCSRVQLQVDESLPSLRIVIQVLIVFFTPGLLPWSMDDSTLLERTIVGVEKLVESSFRSSRPVHRPYIELRYPPYFLLPNLNTLLPRPQR